MLERERHQVEKETQETLTHVIKPKTKYNHRHPKQILAQEALVDFVADDLMLLSLVESVHFRKFASILDPQYQLQSRKHLSTVLLAKKYEDHTSTFTRFFTSLIYMLTACFNSKSHSLPTMQESIWEKFHELCISEIFFRKWRKFLLSSVLKPAFPACTQYVCRKVLKELNKQRFQFNHGLQSGESPTATMMSSIEYDALKYVAEYVSKGLHPNKFFYY